MLFIIKRKHSARLEAFPRRCLYTIVMFQTLFNYEFLQSDMP